MKKVLSLLVVSDETIEQRTARNRAKRLAAKAARDRQSREDWMDSIFKRQYSKKQKALIGVGILFGMGLIGNLLPDTRSPEEKGAGSRRLAELYAMSTCESLVKRNLRDPGSYQRKDQWVSASGERVYIEYRAKNGFGGYNLGTSSCDIIGNSVVLR